MTDNLLDAVTVTPVPKTAIMHDAIHANIEHLPHGFQNAGYTTGSALIKWTKEDWAAHPVAVRIDQDANASDSTADVLDVEKGAATPADAPQWVRQARVAIAERKRLGQRQPTIYGSASNISTITNALIAGGIKSGVNLFIAHFGIGQAEAAKMVETAGGPFPVVGVQYENGPQFDTSVMSGKWLSDRVNNSDWIHLKNIPANSSVFFSQEHHSIGYTDQGGQWVRIPLPSVV